MRKLHIYALNPASGYGGEFRVNNLAFYKKDGTKLEVTDIVGVNDNEATFKVNGISGRIHVPISYGGGYAPKNIFNTTMSVYDSIMTYNNNGAPHENKGFWVYFDKDVSFSYITLAWHYTSQPRDFVVEVDDSPATEPVNASEATIFKLDLPVFKIRCIRGTNGRYYFLKPKKTSNTEEVI